LVGFHIVLLADVKRITWVSAHCEIECAFFFVEVLGDYSLYIPKLKVWSSVYFEKKQALCEFYFVGIKFPEIKVENKCPDNYKS
jgi:hypothetical protein